MINLFIFPTQADDPPGEDVAGPPSTPQFPPEIIMSNNDSDDPDIDDLVQQIAIAIEPIIRDYVDSQSPDPDPGDIDEIVAEVIEQIDIDPGRDIDIDELARQVTEQIESIDIDELADHVAARIDTGAGIDGDNATGELSRLRLAYDPDHTAELATGAPDGQMHSSTGFGPVYEAEQRCHLRGAVVDADERGTVTFRFYELEDGDFDTEVVGDGPYRTRKVEVYGGEQYVPLEVTLDEGYYFVEKDKHLESGGDEVVPLRRSTETPDGINDSDAPLNFVRGYHLDYRPSVDENAYGRFMDGEWSDNYHYCFQVEVGYNDVPEQGG